MVGTWRGIQGYGGKCQVDSEASMRWAVKKIRRGEIGRASCRERVFITV